MTELIYGALILVGVSKLPDIFSTWKYLRPEQERNPVVQWLMRKAGLSFKASILVISLFYYFYLGLHFLVMDEFLDSGLLMQVLTLVVCTVVSYFQIGAYYWNTGKGCFWGMRILLRTRWYS